MQQNLSTEETLKAILSEEYKETLGIDEEGRNLLYTFYEQRRFKPLWAKKKSINATGEELLKLLKHPIRFGMSDKRFDLNWSDDQPIQNEVVIVCGLARSYNDLKYGMLDSTMTHLKPLSYVSLKSLDTLLDFSSNNYAEKIISWGPSDSTYQSLARGLYTFVQNNPIGEHIKELRTIKEDPAAAITGTKEILISKGYLNAEEATDSTTFVTALKKFQTDHGCNPDGVIGTNTVQILTETNLHKAQRIALAMEKQRRKQAYPSRYIAINIPEYMLRLRNEDTLCIETRIVVGKYENQTPELTSGMHTIVVYPYWNVPYSIASKEILPAAQRTPDYFAKNNMVLLQKGDTINPHKVKWKKIKENAFPYRVVQQPGYKNSLGILKFDFYNKYDVYVHDTPSKGLFQTTARAYSHGCIRTENPVDLAKVILGLDENVVVADSLDSLIARTGINHPVKLKKRIPVYVEYNSVIVQNGETKILRDVYLRDDKYLNAMFPGTEDTNHAN
ncbi:L,D-transpeptidase family protein [Crocinitomicaceae bacterium CZZ-1]|uniref:L,D-transpeptidase family protein n=1 Tax=Taishania pollutisoli TaxID=2766479 RepID=A0A8J6U028_9FLAO|nr:L,D-transpeptidase family protein [Taishania pollutisoli]MBC9812938.1 L,D-transpeptidase family protein [Taishania pollutisoli]